MKPGDAAQILNIARSTITKWTAGEYRGYLSPSAQGGTGKQRVINDQDLRILAMIKALKDANTPAEEIHAALQQEQRNGWSGLPDMPTAPADMANVPVVPTAAADAALSTERRALLREITTLQERVEHLESKLDEERVERDKLLREIGDLRAQVSEKDAELIRQLSRAETLLELWQTGKLKPE